MKRPHEFVASPPIIILAGSFLAVQFVQLILVFLFQKVEYDSFTFYFSKVELMRWWTVDHRPLISYVQEFLPIGYSKLQMLFGGGAIEPRNFMNFLVAAIGAAILIRFAGRLFVPFAFFTLANTAFFMQYTGYKTDAPLAVISVLLILAVSQPYFRLQLTAITALVLLMLSIKWSSGPVIAIAAVLYIPRFWHALHNADEKIAVDGFIAAVLGVFLFSYLHLDIYFETFAKTGSFSPTETFGVGALSFRLSHLLLGVPQYVLTAIVETFEPLWRRMLHYPALGSFLEIATLGAKDHVVMSIGEIREGLNLFDAAGIIASVVVLVRFRRSDVFVRNCAIAALFVILLMLTAYPYYPFHTNRYFMSAQVLSYVPLAFLCVTAWERLSSRMPAHRLARTAVLGAAAIAIAHLAISGYMLALDNGRNLVPVNWVAVPTKAIKSGDLPAPQFLKPIYQDTTVERMFRGWSGFQTVYDTMSRTLTTASPLQIVTDSRSIDANYSYPFLRARHPANTSLLDLQNGAFVPGAPYVLCFSAIACASIDQSAAYTKIADQGPTIALWRSR